MFLGLKLMHAPSSSERKEGEEGGEKEEDK